MFDVFFFEKGHYALFKIGHTEFKLLETPK